MLINGISIHLSFVLAPILFIQLFIFTMSLGFFLSAAYVSLRDIGYVWDVILQALFYATPVFFPLSYAPLWAQKIMILNPLAQIIQDLRYVLISEKTRTITQVYGNGVYRLIPVSITVLAFIFAASYFKSRSKFFAEEI